MGGTGEANYNHINENFRQRLNKEKHAAKDFLEHYDYLVWKHTPTHVHRPSASVKVKYYKQQGGDWTVKDKRIALRHAQDTKDVSVRFPQAPCALQSLAAGAVSRPRYAWDAT
jgi:hypothetical protein